MSKGRKLIVLTLTISLYNTYYNGDLLYSTHGTLRSSQTLPLHLKSSNQAEYMITSFF